MFGNRKAEKELLKGGTKDCVTPNYTGFGISNIMPTISKALGLELKNQFTISPDFLDYDIFKGVKNIVFLLLDGLGYEQLLWELKKNKNLALGDVIKDDTFFPLTSTLPSTTTTALTTLNTGLTPQEHGIMGYRMYLARFGVVSNMIRFGPAGGSSTFSEIGLSPASFINLDTIFQKLNKKRVKSFIAAHVNYTDSPLSQMIYRGADYIPFMDTQDMFSQIRKVLERKSSKKSLIYAYLDIIDSASHQHGVKTRALSKEIADLDSCLLNDILNKNHPETLLIISADHGHINSSLKRTVYFHDHGDLLNCLRVPPVEDWGRLSYLFVKKGKKNYVKNYIETNFSKKAFIYDSKDLLERGFFGLNKPRKETLGRIGDLILIPKSNYAFVHPYTIEELFSWVTGRHGGMSKEEMLVPFICKRL